MRCIKYFGVTRHLGTEAKQDKAAAEQIKR